MVEADSSASKTENSEEEFQVLVKSSGLIVSHRPQFNSDSTKLIVAAGSTLQIYSTETFTCIQTINVKNEEDIANFVLSPPVPGSKKTSETAIVCTVNGCLANVDIGSGKVLWKKMLNLEPKGWDPLVRIENFAYHSKLHPFFILAQVAKSVNLMVYSVDYEKLVLERVVPNCLPGNQSMTLGSEGKFLVAVEDHKLHVRDVLNKTTKVHFYGDRKFTCVVAHPTEWSCATGDDTGRVVLWKNPMHANVPARVLYHWHTLPVRALGFSFDGTQIFSGGGECTLVKWDANDASNKRTVPRLGLPIRQVACAPRNTFVAVSQADNSIKIITRDNLVKGEIRNLVQAYVPESSSEKSEAFFGGKEVYAAGIQYDPQTQALVMNGKPGQLQCYSVTQDKYLYDLDITQQNYITSERNKEIPFVHVTHAKFSKNGTWLVTAESRLDGSEVTEARLKFWKFQPSQQKYKLNTSIDWPHEHGIRSLSVQHVEENKDLLVATTGGDKKFKTWGLVYDTSIHGKSEWWNCVNVGNHRNTNAGPSGFSSDGSVLGVAFEQTLTLWNVEEHRLSGSLSHSRLRGSIRLLEFGKRRYSHLALCATENVMFTWDIISHSLLWVVPLKVVALTIDLETEHVAAFSASNNVYMFPLNDVERPVIHKEISSSKIVSCTFVPSEHPSAPGLRSTLVFLTSSQELRVIVPKQASAEEDEKVRVGSKNLDSRNIGLTPFAQLLASKVVNQAGVGANKALETALVGQAGMNVIREIINSSPYTMPSVTFFSDQLLKALTPRRATDNLADVEKHVLQMFDQNSSQVADANGESTKDHVQKLTPAVEISLDTISAEDLSWIDTIVR